MLQQIVSVSFINDTDLMIDGDDSELKMQEIMNIYDQYYGVAEGTIEAEKTTYFAQRWHQKQGQKVIKEKEIKLYVKYKLVKSTKVSKFIQFLGVQIGPTLKQEKQFKVMKEKMKEAIYKIKNIEFYLSIAYIFFNMYLCIKVYFGCKII